MIEIKDNVFALHGGDYTCLLRVNEYGKLEQLHFGAPVCIDDAAALTCTAGLGWGSSVLLDSKNTASSMDFMPLAWSDCGRGDYREAPLETGTATDLRYECHKLVQGDVLMHTLPQARGAGETLVITLSQQNLRCRLYFAVFEDCLTRRTVLENTGDAPVEAGKLMSLCMDLKGELEMTSFHGGWIAEMRAERQKIGMAKAVNESLTGSSSNRHNPAIILHRADACENYGEVFGINLVYSGNHYTSAQRSLQGFTRVVQGINPSNFKKILQKGECFESPEAVICHSNGGFNGMSQKMHRFVNRHIIPAAWQSKPRPVLYNSWEGCMFDFNQRRLMSLAKDAAGLGCELFVLDDGWFGTRNSDTSGLGDYNVNKKKLPSGISGLAKKITALGMQFGLWFEPESVNPDSDLYRAHPNWALTDGFEPVLGRNQLLLDLTQSEVRDYIVKNVGDILDSADISYVKWDMNRHSIALGEKAHDFTVGLYEVQRRIFGPRPHILLENCSSGGNRFDLGMLCMGAQIWCSDNTDPIERLTIQGNLSYMYPQSAFGTHVSASPHAQTLRVTPLSTRGNVSYFGCLGYELDLKHLTAAERKEITAQIEFYKKYREIFQYGKFTRGENSWQVQNENTALVGHFRGLVHAAPPYQWLCVRGLCSDKAYRIYNTAARLHIGQFGSLVKHVLPVNLNPNGAIMRMADKLVALPDGAICKTASGAALSAGIPLLPLFRGTGYNENQRTLTDFGSELYIIEEESR